MALGGVATGNMKANDVDIAVGRAKYKGFTSSTIACKKYKIFSSKYIIVFTKNVIDLSELFILYYCMRFLTNSTKMGMKMVAVAVLLAISVNAAVIMHRTSTRTRGSKSSKDLNASPISADRPDFCEE